MCKYIRAAILVIFIMAYAVVSFSQQVTAGATVATSGTIDNASDELTLSIPNGRGYGTLGISAVGTWSGTIAIQCAAGTSSVGDAPVALTLTPRNSSTTSTSFTSNNQWSASVGGCQRVRAVPTAWTSGSAIITLVAAAVGGSGGGGGGGGSFDGVLLDAPGGDAVTDTVNNAIRANIVAGSTGTATTDPDDASIAAGQTNSNVNALAMAYDGSVWRRLTFGTAGTASTQVLTVQGIASMTPIEVLATPATNYTVVGSLGNDANAAGTNRVTTLPGITEASAPTRTDGRNAALSLTTGGAARVMITNAAGAASTLATDATFGTTTYTETTSTGPIVGGVRNDTPDSLANTTNEAAPLGLNQNGALWTSTIDPCSYLAKTFIPINIATATTTELTAALSGASNYYYVCAINLGPTAGAQNFALVDDDTDGCGSVTSGLAGGTTAGTGWNFAANGGLTWGNGNASIMKTGGTNRVICAVTSAAQQISGVIAVVAAP